MFDAHEAHSHVLSGQHPSSGASDMTKVDDQITDRRCSRASTRRGASAVASLRRRLSPDLAFDDSPYQAKATQGGSLLHRRNFACDARFEIGGEGRGEPADDVLNQAARLN